MPAYTHPHHRLIYRALQDLRADYLADNGTYFAGGTLLSMTMGEYRRSDDIDFIINPGEGYRTLRSDLFARDDLSLLSRNSDSGVTWGTFRADQYGIRGLVSVDETPIKFEIIVDSRIGPLQCCDEPGLPVACLHPAQRLAEKLLANADRGLDPYVHYRDLIDIAVLVDHGEALVEGIALAKQAYEVERPLKTTFSRLTQDSGGRVGHYEALGIARAHMFRVAQGLDKIGAFLGLPAIQRHKFEEQI